jgi:hypothetical protein
MEEKNWRSKIKENGNKIKWEYERSKECKSGIWSRRVEWKRENG